VAELVNVSVSDNSVNCQFDDGTILRFQTTNQKIERMTLWQSDQEQPVLDFTPGSNPGDTECFIGTYKNQKYNARTLALYWRKAWLVLTKLYYERMSVPQGWTLSQDQIGSALFPILELPVTLRTFEKS
jgi:hypothetical protein